MNTIRKAIAAALTGSVTWGTAVTVSDEAQITASEWVVLAGILVGAFLVWLVPNEPLEVTVVEDERGAADMGSIAVGILLGLLFGYLLWGAS